MVQASEKLSSTLKVVTFDFDPDTADATDVGFEDMRDFETLLVVFMRTVGVGNLDTFKLIANSDAAGADTDVTIKTHAIGSQPNAVNDTLILELTAEEVAQEGNDASPKQTDLRHISAQLEFATSTDEGVVFYIFGGARRPNRNLTDNKVA